MHGGGGGSEILINVMSFIKPRKKWKEFVYLSLTDVEKKMLNIYFRLSCRIRLPVCPCVLHLKKNALSPVSP